MEEQMAGQIGHIQNTSHFEQMAEQISHIDHIQNTSHFEQTEEITQLSFDICITGDYINAKNKDLDILYQGRIATDGNTSQRCTTRMITDIIVFTFDSKCSYLTIIFGVETGNDDDSSGESAFNKLNANQIESSLTLTRAKIPYGDDTRYVKIRKHSAITSIRDITNDKTSGIRFRDVIYTLYAAAIESQLRCIVEQQRHAEQMTTA